MENNKTGQPENLCQQVYDKIKQKKIKPKPRWTFLLKNYIFWSFFIFSLFVGSLAFSAIIFMAQNNDWDLHEDLCGSLFKFIFITLPYFWFLLLVLFIFFAYYYLRHTKTGYRYSLLLITVICVGGSAVLGALAYTAGLGQIAENSLSEKIPFYNNLNFNRAKMWVQPERGLLAGTIIRLSDDDIFFLHDFTSRTWSINAQRAKIKNGFRIYIGENIKIIGKKMDENTFRAIEIRPWGTTCIMDRCSMQYRNFIKE